MSESPFIPGARVAVGERYGDCVSEGFVDKVYKSGNFTLRGSKQQWRPWCGMYGEHRWYATATGDSWSRKSLSLWDETTDKEIREKIEAQNVRQRWHHIRAKIDDTKSPTAALCDAIEAALTSGIGSAK